MLPLPSHRAQNEQEPLVHQLVGVQPSHKRAEAAPLLCLELRQVVQVERVSRASDLNE